MYVLYSFFVVVPWKIDGTLSIMVQISPNVYGSKHINDSVTFSNFIAKSLYYYNRPKVCLARLLDDYLWFFFSLF